MNTIIENSDEWFSDILKKYDIIFPGYDLLRTVIFAFIFLAILYFTSDNVFYDIDIADISKENTEIGCSISNTLTLWRNISNFLCLMSIIFLILSFYIAYNNTSSKVCSINNLVKFFMPRILINISLILFFIILAIWICILGGIKNSPFSAILSISPILMYIDAEKNKGKNLTVFLEILTSDNDNVLTTWNRCLTFLKYSSNLIFVIIIIILASGWYELIPKMHISIISSQVWFISIYYIIYYLSVCIALFGVFPSKITYKKSVKEFI